MHILLAFFVMLFLLTKCAGGGDEAKTKVAGAPETKQPLFSNILVDTKNNADCANAVYEINMREYSLEESFHEWRRQYAASYDAQSDAYFRNINPNGSVNDGTYIIGKATEYEKFAVEKENKLKSVLFYNLQRANNTLSWSYLHNCITKDAYETQSAEYDNLVNKH